MGYKFNNIDELIKSAYFIDELVKFAAGKNILDILNTYDISEEELYLLLISQPDYNKKITNSSPGEFKERVLPYLKAKFSGDGGEDKVNTIKESIPELAHLNTIEEMGSFAASQKKENPELFQKWVTINKQLKSQDKPKVEQNQDLDQMAVSGDRFDWYYSNKEDIIKYLNNTSDKQEVFHILEKMYDFFNNATAIKNIKTLMGNGRIDTSNVPEFDESSNVFDFTFSDLLSIHNIIQQYDVRSTSKLKRQVDKVKENESEHYEMVFQSGDFMVFHPLTKEGSCYLARSMGANWCTGAVSSKNMYDSYTQNGGKLYIIYNKATKLSWQYSDRQGEFKDNNNSSILFNVFNLQIGDNKEIKQYLYQLTNRREFLQEDESTIKTNALSEARQAINREVERYNDFDTDSYGGLPRFLDDEQLEMSEGTPEEYIINIIDYKVNYLRNCFSYLKLVKENISAEEAAKLEELILGTPEFNAVNGYAQITKDVNGDYIIGDTYDIKAFDSISEILYQALS